jgi:ubiquitin thioesterase protein OTUB1
MDLLLRRFNDAEISNAIVYHFRLLASSWLKASPTSYQDFIPDGIGVEGYCKDFLEPPNQEIDHLGMTLLIDVLLKPIGFAVEIVYLDRSEGTQVNSHVIRPEDSNGVSTNPGGPIIHLLYRPSHYDILYKERDAHLPVRQQCLDEATSNPNIQVNRATTFSQLNAQSTTSSMNDFANLDLTNLLSIPGFSLPPQPSHHGFPQQYPPVAEYTPSPTSSYPPAPTTASISPISLDTSSASTNFPPSSTLPIHPLPERPAPSSNATTSSFRPSKYEWEAAADWQDTPTPTFQTSTFKNSHYNTAHYNNPNFQPEEWSPECEEMVGSRKRSS